MVIDNVPRSIHLVFLDTLSNNGMADGALVHMFRYVQHRTPELLMVGSGKC